MAEGSGGGGQTARDPSSWTPDMIIQLMAEVDRRYQQRWEAHEAVHEQESEVRSESAKRIDARLEGLNELRQEVLADRNLFMSREAFDAKHEALVSRVDSNEKMLDQWQGRGQGLSMTASLVVGAVVFISTALSIYFALAAG
jgi:hypothetical protein